MKTSLKEHALATLFASLLCLSVHAQGTFLYDQQSSTESNLGEGRAVIQSSQPIGQSFTPTLWFREGIVIPEPSTALLVLTGLGVLLYGPLAKHFRKRMRG